MKYIDSMHHYMDKYGGESCQLLVTSKLQSKSKICVNCRAHNNPSLTFTHG